MRSFYKPTRAPSDKVGSHGVCMEINNLVNIFNYHQHKFNNLDILVLDDVLGKLFNFENKYDTSEYVYDIIPDYNSNLGFNKSNCRTVENFTEEEETEITKKNQIFEKVFKFKEEEYLISEVDKFINDKTLALHIRGTDTIDIYDNNLILNNIDFMLKTYDIDNIFLATDDIKFQNLLIEKYGNIVNYRDKIISYDGQPTFLIPDRTIVNREVIIDVFLLSRSKYFLYSLSNVSYLATTIGINNFEKIKFIGSL